MYRAKLEESLPANEEQSRTKDTATIKLARSAVKEVPPSNTAYKTTVLEGGQQNISRLVTIRRLHQTKRAANSTKSCKIPAPSTPGPVVLQRHQICSQMADVIRRCGTGIERNVRWKSGNTPGTKDSAEVAGLSGNSANAELAAKECVYAVRNSLLLYDFAS